MSAWLLSIPILPLALAVLIFLTHDRAVIIRWAVRLAPLTLLPALAAALTAPETSLVVDAVLLGMHLGIDATGRVFLLLSALAWLFAALYAQSWLASDPARGRFFGFFLAAAAGSLGLCLAQDALSFYWLFALMTFSAWALVLHRATPEARHAGSVYLVIAVLGEAALLVALLLIVAADGMLLADAPAAVAASPWRDVIVALLLIGFGAKTGVLGLHVALPLAYAATPVPGAAVLASAMIKAGLLGWLRFLPLGHALPDWGTLFILLGFAAALYGVIVGLLQQQPKSILAYSSISQMGLIGVGVGLGVMAPAAGAAALFAVTLYALHHALAKAALFLGEGLMRATSGRWRGWVLAGLALPALAIAGAPLTGGALAKQHLKALAPFAPWPDVLTPALMLTSVATTLLMAHFLWRVWRNPDAVPSTGRARLVLPWIALLAAMLISVWWLPLDRAAALAPAALAVAAAPVAFGAFIALLGGRLMRGQRYAVPPGDVLVRGEALGRRVAARVGAWAFSVALPAWQAARLPWQLRSSAWIASPRATRVERWLRSGRRSGVLGLALALALAALLALA